MFAVMADSLNNEQKIFEWSIYLFYNWFLTHRNMRGTVMRYFRQLSLKITFCHVEMIFCNKAFQLIEMKGKEDMTSWE